MFEHFRDRPPLGLRFRLAPFGWDALDGATQSLVLFVEMLEKLFSTRMHTGRIYHVVWTCFRLPLLGSPSSTRPYRLALLAIRVPLPIRPGPSPLNARCIFLMTTMIVRVGTSQESGNALRITRDSRGN
jgi:hypothetical protein